MMPELQVEFLVMSWQQEGTYIKIEAFEDRKLSIACHWRVPKKMFCFQPNAGGFKKKLVLDAAILNPGSKEQDKQVEIEIYTGETLSRGYFCTRTEEKLKMMNVTGSTWLIDIMPVI
ncbi:hypothetical protein MLD38_005400 [Melastoma candidum]|uniref:Uncharacterized protein n=1 Tax=Melastoma candidum TaxID=119954 RepID=A0ACB9RKP4_9MYRT|nr:hypothetical protein MLD38_005400 [Melastoma candidum]